MAIQNAINRAFLGTYSYAGLVLDGTGGNNAAPPAGGIQASGSGAFGGNLSVGGSASVAGNGSFNGGLSVGGPASIGSDIYGGGALHLGARAMSGSMPGNGVQKGILYGDACPIAVGAFGGDGTLRMGFGFQTVKAYGTGVFDITLQNASAGNYQTLIPIACGGNTGTGVLASASGISNNVVRVETYEIGYRTNQTFAMDFNLIVFAQ